MLQSVASYGIDCSANVAACDDGMSSKPKTSENVCELPAAD